MNSLRNFLTVNIGAEMPVKYKGEIEMYFVNGIIPELCDENGGPNRKFIVKDADYQIAGY